MSITSILHVHVHVSKNIHEVNTALYNILLSQQQQQQQQWVYLPNIEKAFVARSQQSYSRRAT